MQYYESIIAAECAQRGLAPDWYRDADGHRSGRSERYRVGWRQLKSHIADADVAVVLAAIQDRASRSVRDTAEMIELCQRHGVHVIFPQSGIDTTRTGFTATVIAQINMNATFAQFYSDDVADKMRAKVKDYRAKGIVWSKPPFGASRVGTGIDATFAPNADHAAMVACLTIYAAGHGYAETAEKLNAQGFVHRNRDRLTQPFTAEGVRTIVGNVLFYAGYVVRGKWQAKKERVALDGEGSHLERYARALNAHRSAAIPPMIDEELANAVIARRHSTQLYRVSLASWTPLLTPLIHADGVALGAQPHRHENWYRARKAGAWIRAADAEAQVIGALSGLQFPPELRDAVRAELARTHGDDARASATEAIQRARAKLGTLAEMRLDGALSREDYNTRYATLEAEMRRHEAVLNAPSEIDRLMDYLGDLGGTLATMTRARQRRQLAHLFERIDFSRDGQLQALHPRAWARVTFGEMGRVCSTALPSTGILNADALQRLILLLMLVGVVPRPTPRPANSDTPRRRPPTSNP